MILSFKHLRSPFVDRPCLLQVGRTIYSDYNGQWVIRSLIKCLPKFQNMINKNIMEIRWKTSAHRLRWISLMVYLMKPMGMIWERESWRMKWQARRNHHHLILEQWLAVLLFGRWRSASVVLLPQAVSKSLPKLNVRWSTQDDWWWRTKIQPVNEDGSIDSGKKEQRSFSA